MSIMFRRKLNYSASRSYNCNLIAKLWCIFNLVNFRSGILTHSTSCVCELHLFQMNKVRLYRVLSIILIV